MWCTGLLVRITVPTEGFQGFLCCLDMPGRAWDRLGRVKKASGPHRIYFPPDSAKKPNVVRFRWTGGRYPFKFLSLNSSHATDTLPMYTRV